MIELDVYHLVLGLSVSGVAAALELRRACRSVVVCDSVSRAERPPDLPIRSRLIVQPTPFNNEAIDAEDWESSALKRLAEAGVVLRSLTWRDGAVWRSDHEKITIIGSPHMEAKDQPVLLRASSVIFAPNGLEEGLLTSTNATKYFARGYATDVWAETGTLMVKDRDVVVVGCGHRLVEQVHHLNGYPASITVICQHESLAVPWNIQPDLRGRQNVRVLYNTEVECVLGDQEQKLTGVVVRRGSYRWKISTSQLYSAAGLVPEWSLWGNRSQAMSIAEHGTLVVAGVAAGVDYWDDYSQYEDGVRSAHKALKRN